VLLKQYPDLAKNSDALWDRIMNGEEKDHNDQTNVVIALWDEGLINAK
jgi:hypothetical protein